jgi:type II secretory pathway component PulM
MNLTNKTNNPVPRIESHREQVKHILDVHKEQLAWLKQRAAELKAGSKRAGSSVDAGSPKRVRTDSQDL